MPYCLTAQGLAACECCELVAVSRTKVTASYSDGLATCRAAAASSSLQKKVIIASEQPKQSVSDSLAQAGMLAESEYNFDQLFLNLHLAAVTWQSEAILPYQHERKTTILSGEAMLTPMAGAWSH